MEVVGEVRAEAARVERRVEVRVVEEAVEEEVAVIRRESGRSQRVEGEAMVRARAAEVAVVEAEEEEAVLLAVWQWERTIRCLAYLSSHCAIQATQKVPIQRSHRAN